MIPEYHGFELKKNKANYTFLFKLLLLSCSFSSLISRNLICILSLHSRGVNNYLFLCMSAQAQLLAIFQAFITQGLLPTVESSKIYG